MRKDSGKFASSKVAPVLTVALALAVISVTSGCGAGAEARLAPREVLARAVDDMLGWKSYRYSGSSKLEFEENHALDSESSFDTELAQNGEGALDGHMVVRSASPGGSYETYFFDGVEYTRVEGGSWQRVLKDEKGAGMVSAQARQLISMFGDVVDDARFEREDDESYALSFSLGEKYMRAAHSLEGSSHAADPASSPASGGYLDENCSITMTLTIRKKTLRMTGVSFTSKSTASSGSPGVTVVTTGTYTAINKPVTINPPYDALNAPLGD